MTSRSYLTTFAQSPSNAYDIAIPRCATALAAGSLAASIRRWKTSRASFVAPSTSSKLAAPEELGLTANSALTAANAPWRDLVLSVLRWEAEGLWFSPGLHKSILYTVAVPGTSQHVALLALDVKEHANPQVRAILAKHGWYHTVLSDAPHFTYLGHDETALPGLGLHAVDVAGVTYWIPNLEEHEARAPSAPGPMVALR